MLLTRDALGNLLARYRAVLQRCRWKNALAALLLTGMVALPVEALDSVYTSHANTLSQMAMQRI